jgi:hypothetical protein
VTINLLYEIINLCYEIVNCYNKFVIDDNKLSIIISAPIIASLPASMVILVYCNFEKIHYRLDQNSKAARFQTSSGSISPCIYCQILVPLRHLYTNAKLKFTDATDRFFNARHRNSNPCPIVKRFNTTAPQKLCNVLLPPGQRWRNSHGQAFKNSALALLTQASTKL